MEKSIVFDSSVAMDVIIYMFGISSNVNFSIESVIKYLGENKMILPTPVVNEIDPMIIDRYPEKTEEYQSLWNSKLDEMEIERYDCETHNDWLIDIQKRIIENPTGKTATNWINLKRSYLISEKIKVHNDMSKNERRKALRILKKEIIKDNRVMSQVMKYSEDHETVLVTNDGDMIMMKDCLESKDGLHLSIWRPQQFRFNKNS